MAKAYSGRDGSLLLGGTTLVKVSRFSLNADVNLLETTTLGDNVRSYSPGIQGFSGTCSVLYYKQDDDSNDASTLLKKLIKVGDTGISASDTVSLTLRLADGTDLNDVTLTAYITGVSFGATVGDVVTAQVSFQAMGALTTASV